ncbi:MAG: hypothetical protein FJX48_05060 [Alphaproteobacteria bacterium]|nr:hypothetical protein [Alphaproteobacteria bacterium]
MVLPQNRDLPKLYEAVGSAISQWSFIELQLYQVFTVCLTLTAMQPGGGFSVDNRVPNAVLDSIEGFRGKLNMIDAAMLAALKGLDDEAIALLRDWAVLKGKVNDLHWNRNALAHWTGWREAKPDGTTAKAYIAPHPFASNDHPRATKTDIDQWAVRFRETGIKLSELVERLASHQGLQHTHVARVASQVLCTLPGDLRLLESLKQELSGHL